MTKHRIERKMQNWKKALGALSVVDYLQWGVSQREGSLTVLLETEDVIVDGLTPGDEAANIKDGWTVEFNKYLATVGDIDLHFSTDEEMEAEAGDVYVVDMTQVPAGGLLWTFENLTEGRWELITVHLVRVMVLPVTKVWKKPITTKWLRTIGPITSMCVNESRWPIMSSYRFSNSRR